MNLRVSTKTLAAVPSSINRYQDSGIIPQHLTHWSLGNVLFLQFLKYYVRIRLADKFMSTSQEVILRSMPQNSLNDKEKGLLSSGNYLLFEQI